MVEYDVQKVGNVYVLSRVEDNNVAYQECYGTFRDLMVDLRREVKSGDVIRRGSLPGNERAGLENLIIRMTRRDGLM